jgi:hypothetical protein
MRFDRLKTGRYLNGNYLVKTSSMGKSFFGISKRALRVGEELRSEFPDSIDLKISDRCSHGCPFCHESSTKEGKVLNLEKTKEILSQLPKKPIEIAIGGGNVLECLDETEDILDWLLERGHQTRITITLDDLKGTGNDGLDERIIKLILNKVGGLGVSITSLEKSGIKFKDSQNAFFRTGIIDQTKIGKELGFGPQVVYHVIAGITPLKDIKQIIDRKKDSVLVLGYKQWGRAIGSKLPDMTELRTYLETLIHSSATDLGCLGFDNLAIEQLGVKDMIDENRWKGIYLGDEGTCSMYIDAVKGEFARTSRSPERVSWNDVKLLDYYASLSN